MANLLDYFGFKILRNKDESVEDTAPSFSKPVYDDGSSSIYTTGYATSSSFDLDGLSRNQTEAIKKYREISLYPETDLAVQDIVNEAITEDEVGQIVKLEIEDDNIDPRIKRKIIREMDNVLELLGFDETGADIFRKWYVEGLLAYHIIIDPQDIKAGIKDLRQIDAVNIRKIVEFEEKPSVHTGANLIRKVDEYFIYSEAAFTGAQTTVTSGSVNMTTGLKISPDTILYCSSGLVDPNTGNNLSYLHKAIRPTNQLRMLEDSSMVYYMSRAPERRIFYINVEGMTYSKADTYINNFKNNFRNKTVYDSTTGEVRDDKKFMSMQDDLWIPRTGDGKQTEVTTLTGGANLDSILAMLKEFEKKLYMSLNVPISRLESGQAFSGSGRSTEITRDEVKFDKFIKKLRRRFSTLFLDALRIQCILKGIVTVSDWETIVKKLRVVFSKDNHFVELKEMEILQGRLDTLSKLDNYVGSYFSREYVFTHVLGMTKDEARLMEEQIQKERVFNPDEMKPGKPADDGMGGGDFGGSMDMGGGLDMNAPMDDSMGAGMDEFGTEGGMGGEMAPATGDETGMATIGPDETGLEEPPEEEKAPAA